MLRFTSHMRDTYEIEKFLNLFKKDKIRTFYLNKKCFSETNIRSIHLCPKQPTFFLVAKYEEENDIEDFCIHLDGEDIFRLKDKFENIYKEVKRMSLQEEKENLEKRLVRINEQLKEE